MALQLFSVREQCVKDLEGTLSRVARFGCEGVKLAGYYGRSAAELRGLLEAQGPPCCGAHVPFESLLGSELAATVRFQKIPGNRNLTVPGLPPEAMLSLEAWRSTARRFTEISRFLRGYHMRLWRH